MENDAATTTQIDEDDDFAAGFNETAAAPAEPAAAASTQDKPADAPAQAAATTEGAPATQAADDTAAAPAADPFGDLPPAVRNLLAEIPQLRTRTETAERELREVKGLAGRVPGLMSEVARIKSPAVAAPPAPPAEDPKVKALRDQGLDEIADAIQAVAAQPKPEPAPSAPPPPTQAAPAAAPSDPQTEALDELRPDWAEVLTSTEFQLMLAAKGKDYATRVATTSRAKDILGALKDFDEYRASHAGGNAPPPPPPPGGSRQARVAAAVTPQGDGRPASRRPQPLDEDSAFEAGFHGRSP